MTDVGAIITRYIELVGAHDLEPLQELFADDLVATTNGQRFDKEQWIVALRRLLPALVRNEIRDVFVKDEKAIVVYDFVTDTDAGAVPCVEWVTVRDGRISELELIFERANWGAVAAVLQERAAVG